MRDIKILEKSGNEMLLLALANEEIVRGEYVIIEEDRQDRKMVVQIYDISYVSTQDLLNDLIREEVLTATTNGIECDPLEINSLSRLIKDMKLLKCKIRGVVDDKGFTPNISWLPSRVYSRIRKLSITELFKLVKRKGERIISIGKTENEENFHIFAELIDGQLNIITGKKGTGKSHISKLLIKRLVEYGAYVFVFDINDEYIGLGKNRNGVPNTIMEKMVNLKPGINLQFSLKYVGLSSMITVLQHALDIPGASLREFIRLWDTLEFQKSVDMHSLGEAIRSCRCNEFIRDALFSRYHTLISSKLFSEEDGLKLEELFLKNKQGGVFVISLGRIQSVTRKILVEIILSKIMKLLEQKKIPPIFLFAEEAHLYLRETYWDDIVTRMRHFGIFPTFITNQPDAIKDAIYRQCDNLILFNFTNDSDLEMVSRISTVDSDTIKKMAKTIPPGTCIVLGKVAYDLPVIVSVETTDIQTMGETNLFFKDHLQESLEIEIRN